MILRIYFLFSIFFICNSLNAIAPGRDNRRDRTKIKLLYSKSISYINPITYAVFLMEIMNSERGIPTDITDKILQYSIWLKDENFIENFPYFNEWYDFRIPIQYLYTLSSQQLNTLSNVFINTPRNIVVYDLYKHNGNIIHTPFRQTLYYYLQSKEHYKLFLQLPIEVRTCLTKRPESAVNQYPSIKSQKINKHKKILVLSNDQTGFYHKSIVPKEKNKKNLLKFLEKK